MDNFRIDLQITGKGFAKLRQKLGCHSFGGVILQNPSLLYIHKIITFKINKTEVN